MTLIFVYLFALAVFIERPQDENKIDALNISK